MTNRRLEKDLSNFLSIYPNYSYNERPELKFSILSGPLDICGLDGSYLDSFNIEIYLNKEEYPNIVPVVKEVGGKIKRGAINHLDKDGYCCLDMIHELEFLAKKGISIVPFYREKIYPFFANAVYKSIEGQYAAGEYDHDFKGVVQFYKEKLFLESPKIIVELLLAIKKNKLPSRNDLCLCGSQKKFKNCHLKQIEFLKSLNKQRIIADIEGFEKLIIDEY